VDIHAHWSEQPPAYRIYVDDELMTERDFIWPGSEKYVTENIIVDVEPGDHMLRIDQVKKDGSIIAKNIQVNGIPSSNKFVTTE
jgi:hypothetical protein